MDQRQMDRDMALFERPEMTAEERIRKARELLPDTHVVVPKKLTMAQLDNASHATEFKLSPREARDFYDEALRSAGYDAALSASEEER